MIYSLRKTTRTDGIAKRFWVGVSTPRFVAISFKPLFFPQATYTNIENHPRLIRARDPRPTPKIVFDRKTGLPLVVNAAEKNEKTKAPARRAPFSGSDDTEGSDTDSDQGESKYM